MDFPYNESVLFPDGCTSSPGEGERTHGGGHMSTILKLEHIQKYYGSEGNLTKAIKDISFSVEEGEFLGIMGASGSGKTT